MAQKHSVGLVLFTSLPLPNEDEWRVILQIRGEYNPEKSGPESWPGACQVTCHGSVESGEDERAALEREFREELGSEAAHFVFERTSMKKIYNEVRTDKLVTTFACIVPFQLVNLCRLGPASGGLRLLPIRFIDQIADLRKFDRQKGVTDRNITAMFPDEITTLKKAVETFF